MLAPLHVRKSYSPQASSYFRRVSGLSSTDKSRYDKLIRGLIADGIWPLLDFLYILAAPNRVAATHNLVSSNYTLTENGSPAFSTYSGYTGVDSSTTVYLNTGFAPSAAAGQFATNSCHLSAWSLTEAAAGASGGCVIGGDGTNAGANNSNLIPRYADNHTYPRINDGTAAGAQVLGTSLGHFIVSRTGASTTTVYHNGSSFATPNTAAGTLQNVNIVILANNSGNAGIYQGGGYQISVASAGAGLDSTKSANFYSRLSTFMTSIGH